jgi:hypothetical protein
LGDPARDIFVVLRNLLFDSSLTLKMISAPFFRHSRAGGNPGIQAVLLDPRFHGDYD